MIAVTTRAIPKTYASLAGSGFGAMVSPPGAEWMSPCRTLEGLVERCVSYVTLRRLSKKCDVAKRPHGIGDHLGPGLIPSFSPSSEDCPGAPNSRWRRASAALAARRRACARSRPGG